MNSRGISSLTGSQAKRILKAIFRAWWNPSSRSCASRIWSIRDMYADALDLPVSPGATNAGSPRLSPKRLVPRSEERRVGKACVRTCGYCGCSHNVKNKYILDHKKKEQDN